MLRLTLLGAELLHEKFLGLFLFLAMISQKNNAEFDLDALLRETLPKEEEDDNDVDLNDPELLVCGLFLPAKRERPRSLLLTLAPL